MLNVAPQKERISDHLRAMAEQDDKSAASGKTGGKSTIGVGCAPGEERGAAIDICAIHSPTVTAAVAEYCEDSVERQKALTEVLDGLVDLTVRLASLATARRSAIVEEVVSTSIENLRKARTQLGGTRFTHSQFVGQFTATISAAWDDVAKTVVDDALKADLSLSTIAEDNETSAEVNDGQAQRIADLESQKDTQSATIATQAEELAMMTDRVNQLQALQVAPTTTTAGRPSVLCPKRAPHRKTNTPPHPRSPIPGA